MLCDAHCHFFSSRFLDLLTRGAARPLAGEPAEAVAESLGWDAPGTPEQLADRWASELDRHSVARTALIASIPGDEESVRTAVIRHPRRFVGYFMFNPAAPDADSRLAALLDGQRLRVVALFPAMHGYRLDDPVVDAVFVRATAMRAAVFVHCGVLTVGVRKRLALPSAFDLRLGDPLAAAAVAARHPAVPVIIPHFGAGLLREALMAADQSANILLDTSSSNGWMKYHPGLTLAAVFRQAVSVVGADRLLFGTDSSFFPRGWNRQVHDAQMAAIAAAGIDEEGRDRIMGGNFHRLFPQPEAGGSSPG